VSECWYDCQGIEFPDESSVGWVGGCGVCVCVCVCAQNLGSV
jgi:hypothetical protein